MKHTVVWYVVTYQDGSRQSAVVSESSDIVQFFYSKLDAYFEAEAYHLSSWCREFGFQLESGRLDLNLPIRG